MLHLIGGTIRSGKSIVANALIAKRPMPLIPVDVVRFTLHNAVPCSNIDMHEPQPGRTINFLPVSFELARQLVEHNPDSIIEGDVISPRLVAQLRSEGIPVRAVFMGNTRPDLGAVLQHEGHDRWLCDRSPAEQSERMAEITRESLALQAECQAASIAFFDTADGFEQSVESATRYLLT